MGGHKSGGGDSSLAAIAELATNAGRYGVRVLVRRPGRELHPNTRIKTTLSVNSLSTVPFSARHPLMRPDDGMRCGRDGLCCAHHHPVDGGSSTRRSRCQPRRWGPRSWQCHIVPKWPFAAPLWQCVAKTSSNLQSASFIFVSHVKLCYRRPLASGTLDLHGNVDCSVDAARNPCRIGGLDPTTTNNICECPWEARPWPRLLS